MIAKSRFYLVNIPRSNPRAAVLVLDKSFASEREANMFKSTGVHSEYVPLRGEAVLDYVEKYGAPLQIVPLKNLGL